MPDEFGRFTLQDGMGIASGVQGLERMDMTRRAIAQDDEDRIKKQQREEVTKSVLRAKSMGQPVDPQLMERDPIGVFNAEVSLLEKSNAEISNDANRRKIAQADVSATRAKLSIISSQINKETDPVKKQALQDQFDNEGAKVYKHFPDGYSFSRFETEKGIKYAILKNGFGEDAKKVPVPDREEALQSISMLDENFLSFHNQKQDLRKTNKDLINDGVSKAINENYFFQNSKGERGAFVSAYDEDGQLRSSVISEKTGKIVQGYDPATGEYIQPKDRFFSPEHWQAGSKQGEEQTKKQGEEFKRIETKLDNAKKSTDYYIKQLGIKDEIIPGAEQSDTITRLDSIYKANPNSKQGRLAAKALKGLERVADLSSQLDSFGEQRQPKKITTDNPDEFMDQAIGKPKTGKPEEKPEAPKESVKTEQKKAKSPLVVRESKEESRYEKLKRGYGYLTQGLKEATEITPDQVKERKKRLLGQR